MRTVMSLAGLVSFFAFFVYLVKYFKAKKADNPPKPAKLYWKRMWICVGIFFIACLLTPKANKTNTVVKDNTNASEASTTADTAAASVAAEEEPDIADTSNAEKENESVSEEEPDTEKSKAQINKEFVEKNQNSFIVLAEKALDNYIADYDVPYNPADWTISKFDDTDTLIGITKVTYKSQKWDYVYVGTLNFDEKGEVTSGTRHYVELGGQVLENDGYCDEVFNKLKGLTETSEDDKSDWTSEQINAYNSAKGYLNYTAFSRQGLIDQLVYEQYSEEAAEFAVSQIEERGEVDWYEQAERSARQYLDYTSFSKQGLIDQLSSDAGGKFTYEQAERAVESVYDE